ncbi:MAG TPA: PAS domain-containing protein [Methylomirabilota bacterium]|jgi:PAS domain S-box-containing protein
MPTPSPSPAIRYGVGLAAFILAVTLTVLVPTLSRHLPFALIFAAVAVAAWQGGRGPALLVSALGAAAGALIPPLTGSPALDGAAVVRIGVFAVVALVITALIARRESAERNLESTRRFLQAVLDGAPAVVYCRDLDGRITLINRRYEELFHVTREGVIGKRSHDIFPAELADRFRANDLAALAAGRPVEFEEVVHQDDGVHTYISLKFPLRDATGTVTGVCGISTDISARQRSEREVHEQREWLNVTLASIGDAVIATDTAARITFMNGVAEKLTGWTAGEATGTALGDVFRIVDERTREPRESPVDKVLREGTVVGLANHTVLLARDGREIPIDDSGAPIRDAEGTIIGVVLVFREISERRRLEIERAQILELERSARAVAQAAQERASFVARASTVLASSLDYGTTLAAVARLIVPELTDTCFVDLLDDDGTLRRVTVPHGDPALESLAADFTRSYAPDLDSEHPLARVLRTGEPVRYPEVSDSLLGTLAADADSLARVRALRLSSLMIVPLAARGRTVGALWLVSQTPGRRYSAGDLTLAEDLARRIAAAVDNALLYAEAERRRQEAETAQRRFAFLADASTALSSALDIDTTLQRVARLAVPFLADWCAIDAVRPDGALARTAVAHVDPDLEPLARELQSRFPEALPGSAAVMRSGKPEFRPVTDDADLLGDAADDDQRRIVRALGVSSYICVPISTAAGATGAITLAHGVSRRRYGLDDLRLAEALARRAASAVDNARLYRHAQEANRAKDEFLATLSHELRTPLHAMLGWTGILRRATMDSAEHNRAIEVIERNTRLQAQLIEDLLDVSRIVTGKLRLDVRPLDLPPVIEAALDSVRVAAAAKAIRIETALDTDVGPVSGDADRLQQVVWNLLSNAIKFTPRDGRVSVSLEGIGDHARISVSDTGVGISPAFLPHLFERFRQADSTATRTHGGLGIGLALVRHLVELHGGRVRAESAGEGQGATFTVELPLLPTTTTPAALRSELTPAAEGLPALDGVRVLVVDDEADARELVTAVLERCGAIVEPAASAAEAEAALERSTPDVVVSDVGLPGEDGYALVRKLRSLDGERAGIPAVALTAYAHPADRTRALLAGFQMHLAKPIEPEELAAVVANLARLRRR